MKKIITFLFLLVEFCALAQIPMHVNGNGPVGNNAIPFNSGGTLTWRRAQFCFPAGSIGAVGPGNNITTVYFQAASGANVTYPTFTVRLKTATAAGMTGVTGGQFEGGMTQVFQATNYNMVATTGGWVGITLQTPFLYDPAFPLIVDFEHDHPNAAGPGVMQSGAIGFGNGRQYGSNNGGTISGVGGTILNFGIDVLPATPCTVAPQPNSSFPASYYLSWFFQPWTKYCKFLFFWWNHLSMVFLYNITGRTV